MKKIILMMALMCIAGSNSVLASDIPEKIEAQATLPDHSKFGMYGTFIGDPGLNALGVNLVYEANESIRLNFGFGTLGKVGNSIGASAHYLIQTNSRFRPFVGLGITALILNSPDAKEFTPIQMTTSNYWVGLPDRSTLYPTFKVGVQYDAPTGFFVGLHISTYVLSYSNNETLVRVMPIPSLSMGSFF